jgi:hypothetical protein
MHEDEGTFLLSPSIYISIGTRANALQKSAFMGESRPDEIVSQKTRWHIFIKEYAKLN